MDSGHLELVCGHLELVWGHLELLCCHLELVCAHLEMACGHLEIVYGHLKMVSEHLEMVFQHLVMDFEYQDVIGSLCKGRNMPISVLAVDWAVIVKIKTILVFWLSCLQFFPDLNKKFTGGQVHYCLCYIMFSFLKVFDFCSAGARFSMFVGVSRHAKYPFWQPCCRNLAALMVLHFHKSFHRISRPQKHGSRSKNHVSKSIRREVMPKCLKSGQSLLKSGYFGFLPLLSLIFFRFS